MTVRPAFTNDSHHTEYCLSANRFGDGFDCCCPKAPPLPILIDCDEVLSDFVGEVLRMARAAGVTATREDVTQWDIGAAIGFPQWGDAVAQYIRENGVANMPEIPGGLAWLRDVEKRFGADRVIVCTSPWNPGWAGQRAAWLEARGVPLKRQMQGLAKHLIAGHLVDDALKNCKVRGVHQAFLLAQPWNKEGLVDVPRGDYTAAMAWLKEVAS